MGNLLCLPKKRRKSDSESSKKQRKGSPKKSRKIDCNQNDEKGGDASLNGAHSSDNSVHKQDPQIKRFKSDEIYVCPVVSSSILLRYDDTDSEDDDSNNQLSKTHDEKKQVDQTNQSVNTETGSTCAAEKKKIDDTETVVPFIERLSEELTATAQAFTTKEVPLNTVRVIQVQGVNGSFSHENTEEKCTIEEIKSTEKRIQDEEQIVRTKPVEFDESTKTKKPGTPSEDLNELDSKVQKNAEKQTCSKKTKEDLTCNKSDECKTDENCMDDIFLTKQVKIDLPVDKEKVKQSRFIVEKVLEKTTPDVDVNIVTEDDKIGREEGHSHTKETRTLNDKDKTDGDQDIDKTQVMIDKRTGLKNLQRIAVEPIEASGKTREPRETGERKHVAPTSSIVGKVLPKSDFEIKATNGIADVETTIKEFNIKGAISCPSVAKKRLISSYIDKCDALLNVLSTLQTPQESTKSDHGVSASINRRLVFGPQSDSSDKHGVYKSKQGIENWINNIGPGTSSSPATDESQSSVTSTSHKKVSDFNVPWKPRKLPPKPLPLKKPSSHLYKIPDLAQSDLDDDIVNWTQLEPRGPQTEVLWTTKPSAFDVKLPPLPKRLLERKGSVEKLQESWIIPQVKQIETLKREHGRFPGLVVPTALRNKYSVDIEKETETTNEDVTC